MGGSLGMGRGLFSRESWFHFLHNKKLCLEQKKLTVSSMGCK